MNIGFYPKLAFSSMRKNKRFYLPYILTCIGMVMMQYIIVFLSVTPVFSKMPGAGSLQMMLGLGGYIIGIFSVIFLFYTNSFLMRRRRKEFGLYNILGMGKFNIGRVLFWETVLTAAIALSVGLGLGIVLSKAAELSLMNMLHGDISYTISVSGKAIMTTLLCFLAIFALLMVNSLVKLSISSPISMLRSENVGEKKPKGNWLLGLIGLLFVGGAYYMALTIKNPLSALMWFFVAVIMVIVGTYMLFISGSVLMCNILKKNKKYYYNPKHFVSVSSMAYRMKRNGAGLASICILGTMVLVMIASTSCLYFGAEDAMGSRYPREINSTVTFEDPSEMSEENVAILREKAETAAAGEGVTEKNILDYRYAQATGVVDETGEIDVDIAYLSEVSESDIDNLYIYYFMSLDDYNKMTNQNKTLEDNQALIYVNRGEYDYKKIKIGDNINYEIVEEVDECVDSPYASMDAVSSVFIVVKDLDSCMEILDALSEMYGQTLIQLRWNYGFDTGLSDERQIEVRDSMIGTFDNLLRDGESSFSGVSCESLADNKADFYGTFGGLLFLGAMLSIVFIFAAVLIIYYKQISEGYEDQSRFDIMQKVGMTKREIRKSINSQLLIVFFLPLVAAGIHLTFAFPFVHKMLLLFNLMNAKLLIATTAITFLIFAAFYMLVYRITSNAYYKIVADKK
ncbi:MAG: FtsX-like permease family protein [Anaerovoracaceae bacterium]|jgi:putative ABC transport system permease protein